MDGSSSLAEAASRAWFRQLGKVPWMRAQKTDEQEGWGLGWVGLCRDEGVFSGAGGVDGGIVEENDRTFGRSGSAGPCRVGRLWWVSGLKVAREYFRIHCLACLQ